MVNVALPGLIALNITVLSLKKFFDRPKPGDSVLTVDLTESFPSGHSANSVYLATTYSAFIPELASLAYGLAVLVCFYLVYPGAHYPLGVLAGASLDAFVALLI